MTKIEKANALISEGRLSEARALFDPDQMKKDLDRIIEEQVAIEAKLVEVRDEIKKLTLNHG